MAWTIDEHRIFQENVPDTVKWFRTHAERPERMAIAVNNDGVTVDYIDQTLILKKGQKVFYVKDIDAFVPSHQLEIKKGVKL